MDREVETVVKLILKGGDVTPVPPVGPALGQHGVNIGQFCCRFNDQTRERHEETIPVLVTIYKDKSFSFVVKQPTTTSLLKEAAEIHKGSERPNTQKVGSITQDQLEHIARIKIPDLNTSNLKAAIRIIAGTAQSMGIEIVD